MLNKVVSGVDRGAEWLAAAIFGVIVAIALVQVFCRYTLNVSLSWSEEAQIFGHIWIVFLGIPIAYRLGNTIAAALTLNISHGGLAIRTTNPLDAETIVKLRFRLPISAKDIDAEARVAWADRRTGMGLQFTLVTSDDQATIDDFVRRHFFTNRKA